MSVQSSSMLKFVPGYIVLVALNFHEKILNDFIHLDFEKFNRIVAIISQIFKFCIFWVIYQIVQIWILISRKGKCCKNGWRPLLFDCFLKFSLLITPILI